MFKRRLALIVLVLVMSMFSISALAGSPSDERPSTADFTEYYAYLDLDTAPDELKPLIIEARNSIIYSKSWTVDGQCSLYTPDGTLEALPEFSELFPGWDVPAAGSE